MSSLWIDGILYFGNLRFWKNAGPLPCCRFLHNIVLKKSHVLEQLSHSKSVQTAILHEKKNRPQPYNLAPATSSMILRLRWMGTFVNMGKADTYWANAKTLNMLPRPCKSAELKYSMRHGRATFPCWCMMVWLCSRRSGNLPCPRDAS